MFGMHKLINEECEITIQPAGNCWTRTENRLMVMILTVQPAIQHHLEIPTPCKIDHNFRRLPCVVPQRWNELPIHIQSSDFISTFKNHLKTHLFQEYLNWLTQPTIQLSPSSSAPPLVMVYTCFIGTPCLWCLGPS